MMGIEWMAKLQRDYAMAYGDHGQLVLHRIDCPDVRAQAAAGEPVLNLFDCQKDPPKDEVERHSCLKGH